MTTPKHMKIQTLLSAILLVVGYLIADYYYDPRYGITLYHALPVLIGAVWLTSVLFVMWWRKP